MYTRAVEIGLHTAELWIAAGVIWLSSIGEENIYFENEFGMRFFFKAADAGAE